MPSTSMAQSNPEFQKISTNPEDKIKLYEMVKKFSVGLLVTQTSTQELRARPMHVAKVSSDDCNVWFATNVKDSKCFEIKDHDNVCVSFQGNHIYISLSGFATVIRDQAIIDNLWTDNWKTYFPKGKNDPDLFLLRVQTTHAEFWDYSGTSVITHAFESAKARMKGVQPDPESLGKHCKVDLSHAPTNTPLVS